MKLILKGFPYLFPLVSGNFVIINILSIHHGNEDGCMRTEGPATDINFLIEFLSHSN